MGSGWDGRANQHTQSLWHLRRDLHAHCCCNSGYCKTTLAPEYYPETTPIAQIQPFSFSKPYITHNCHAEKEESLNLQQHTQRCLEWRYFQLSQRSCRISIKYRCSPAWLQVFQHFSVLEHTHHCLSTYRPYDSAAQQVCTDLTLVSRKKRSPASNPWT